MRTTDPTPRPPTPLHPRVPGRPLLALVAAGVFVAPCGARAQADFTIEQVLSPGFPYELVSARGADRIAWIEYERGMRNVYTATPPDFTPVRLTSFLEDDGIDLTELSITDDGALVTFVRGHDPNRAGWIANPTSDPRGGERAVWAVATSGGNAWRVADVRDYALSPDGRWIAYVRDGQILRAPIGSGLRPTEPTGEPFFRTFGDNAGPTWSPDGSRVAFVSRREDHAFIGVYDARSPAIIYMAPGVDRDSSPTWSPDGTRIAYLRRPGLAFGAEPSTGRFGGGGRRAEASAGDSTNAPPAGLFESKFRGGHELEIWIADATTGEGSRLWAAPPDDRGFNEIRQIHWVGDHILFEAEPGNWRHWFSIGVQSAEATPTELTPGEGMVEQVAFSSDGSTLFYASNVDDIDHRDLWSVPVSGGRAHRLTEGGGIETYPAVLASGDRVALLYADAKRPQSVAVVPARGGEAQVITSLPDEFPTIAHVVPEDVTLSAPDGLEYHNQLFLPPDLRAGEQRPAVIFIHGGSRRQMLLGYHYMHFYHMAYAINQYLASEGYVVMSVNYRSGIGYGREFRDAPGRGREGNTEYQDILAAGKYLQARPDVDPDRVGLWGLSYGGILTAQALARNSDVFRAGVDMAGVHLYGEPTDRESVAYQSSAIAAIDSWTSPVLLIHGDDDRNVDFSQTVGLVQLLRQRDIPFELIVFPDDVHDSLLFRRWLTAFGATDDFLKRRLWNAGDRVTNEAGRPPADPSRDR
jgi:dipeptidyl-peptidase-4